MFDGKTQFTLIPFVITSLEIDFKEAHSAAFEPAYAICPLSEHFEAIEEIAKANAEYIGYSTANAEAREMFDLQPGDEIIVLGDTERGLAILPKEEITIFYVQQVLKSIIRPLRGKIRDSVLKDIG